jgi:hypothetical protein
MRMLKLTPEELNDLVSSIFNTVLSLTTGTILASATCTFLSFTSLLKFSQ